MDNTFLDALVCRGVLISVSVRYWRAQKKLRPEDLGLTSDQIDDGLISLGHKRLVTKDVLQDLKLIEGRAHAVVEENTFPFLNGVARYLPNPKLETVTTRLEELKTEFTMARRSFMENYGETRTDAVARWRDSAAMLVDDPERVAAVIGQAFPPLEAMPRYFGFDVRCFQLAVPDVPTAELIELGTQEDLIAARRQAAQAARLEIQQSCREFITESVATLREQTAKLCDEMLSTINGTQSVHQKTLNRLKKFIDHFQALNFMNDREMDQQLELVRKQFLTRTAQEFRDSSSARDRLVSGLSALRDSARELAATDATELVRSFGSMGAQTFPARRLTAATLVTVTTWDRQVPCRGGSDRLGQLHLQVWSEPRAVPASYTPDRKGGPVSHFTTIDVQVKDIEALRLACAELDLTLEHNTHARGYGANRIHGDHVIRLKGPYDIAVQRQDDGNHTLVADLWAGHVEREVGTGFGRLKQLYGVHKAATEARRRGLHVRRTTLANGQIQLALSHV